jgi:hypothetical protein
MTQDQPRREPEWITYDEMVATLLDSRGKRTYRELAMTRFGPRPQPLNERFTYAVAVIVSFLGLALPTIGAAHLRLGGALVGIAGLVYFFMALACVAHALEWLERKRVSGWEERVSDLARTLEAFDDPESRAQLAVRIREDAEYVAKARARRTARRA